MPDPRTPDASEGRQRARAESRAAVFFAASTVASILLAVLYWRGGQPQLEGVLLGVICGGIGFGIVTGARHAMPHDEVTEERGTLASSEEDVEAFAADFRIG